MNFDGDLWLLLHCLGSCGSKYVGQKNWLLGCYHGLHNGGHCDGERGGQREGIRPLLPKKVNGRATQETEGSTASQKGVEGSHQKRRQRRGRWRVVRQRGRRCRSMRRQAAARPWG